MLKITTIDPDTDTLTHHEYLDDKGTAILRAQELFNSTENLCWDVVTVRKQIVDWFRRAPNRLGRYGRRNSRLRIVKRNLELLQTRRQLFHKLHARP